MMLTVVQCRKMRAIEPEHCQHCVINGMHSRQATNEFGARNLYATGLKRVPSAAFNYTAFDGFNFEMVT
ncbi:TPA: hypothetical protein QDE50_21905 [Burkholderia cenocepacia]|jgi:hypothetical protein|uniref:Uncharacterized protein n=1 Tax=Burkholderia latens TaxID=488446 RepID=A0A6P2HRA9_9BURK|nr:hypothetical protein BLA24064_00755 [Burkholderia latens]HDR9879695.1 hypothetical protein [Burkholderia cenocepacia]HDR9886784.1 hypothetical protein [Burkholderia cenocepacia]